MVYKIMECLVRLMCDGIRKYLGQRVQYIEKEETPHSVSIGWRGEERRIKEDD